MSNPISGNPITVKSALYGIPGNVVDVTATVQGFFEEAYNNNKNITAYTLQSIQPTLFGISDPAQGVPKAFTIVYNLPNVGTDLFMRGAQDYENLTLIAGPKRTIQVTQAIYASNNVGLDVTEKLAAYLRDPGNDSSLTIGAQRPFRDVLTDGADIDPNNCKYFSVSYTNSTGPQYLCGYDNQTVNIS